MGDTIHANWHSFDNASQEINLLDENMTSRAGKQVVNVLIKIVVKKYKKEEFLESMQIYQANIRKQPSCLSFNIYHDAEEANTFRLVGEWKSAQAMEKHFKTREFELLLGAAKVLSNTFEIETSEVLHTGNLDWARRKIRSRKNTR